MYFNAFGINEFDLPKDVGIMPGEEILVVNIDKEINEMQKQKLEALNPRKYIKRKGDANSIIPEEKTILISPKGWLLEYEQNPRHHENEIFNMEVNLQKSDIAWIGFKVNDEVAIEY